jgi:hypothetical protein
MKRGYNKIGFFIRSSNGTTIETFLNGTRVDNPIWLPILSKKEERQVKKIMRKYLKSLK